MDYKKQFETVKRFLQFRIENLISDEQKLDQLLSHFDRYSVPMVLPNWSQLDNRLQSVTLVWETPELTAKLFVYLAIDKAVFDDGELKCQIDLERPLAGPLGAFLNQHCLIKSTEA